MFQYRIHDARLGRFLSVDPLSSKYPWYTPYQFAGNKPSIATDLEGLEEHIYHYRYNDGEPILIDKVYNVEWRVDESNSSSHGIVYIPYNKATGEPLRDDEFGKAQYQYFDEVNKRIEIRRNLNGNFVKGDNELMDDYTGNMLGSIYIGANNPPKVNGQDDYRREPKDEAGAIAKQHDKDFDNAVEGGLKGFSGTMDDKSTPLNEKALKAANELLTKKIDRITGRPVTDLTRKRAKRITQFKWAERLKRLKRNPPNQIIKHQLNHPKLK